jgi:hypothetical protein
MNFGTLAKSAYVYLFDSQTDFERVTLVYDAGGTEQRVTKKASPGNSPSRSMSMPKAFRFRFETTGKQSLIPTVFGSAGEFGLGQLYREKAIDGVVSDASRWISARDQEGPSWLELNLDEPKKIGWLAVASGFQNRSAVESFVLQYQRDGQWHDIPSTSVTNNQATNIEITIPEQEQVTADHLRFVFPHATGEVVRIKEIFINEKVPKDGRQTSPTYRLQR